MIRNEPSDRQDRRIQRRKLWAMWASLADEKARIESIPVASRKVVHYIRPGEVDETGQFDRIMFGIIIGMVTISAIVCAVI